MSSSSSNPRDQRKPAGPKATSKAGTKPTIGSYRILEVIGKGGMGTVYKAVHTGLDRVVALKVLPTEYARNPILLKRFKREAKSAAELHHPNIVAVHDQGESGGNYYLALEYVDGQDLHSLVRKRERLSPRRCVEIIKHAAQALVHAHSKGIIHRDIKPSNLLVRRDGNVMLADLGLATRGDATHEAQVTRAGTTVGTVDYMAPEQARGGDLADARSDIYSLGCTLYHMLAGRPPFPSGSIPEKLLAHARKQPHNIQQLNPEVPDELVAVLNRMMAKEPIARYQSAHELFAELEQLTLRRAPAPRQDLASLAEALDDEPTEKSPLPSRRARHSGADTAPPPRSRRRRGAEPPSPEALPREPTADSKRAPSETPPLLFRSRHTSGPKRRAVLSSQQWIYLAGGAGVLLLIALIVYVTVNISDATSPSAGSLNRNLTLPPAPVANEGEPRTSDAAKESADVFPEMGILNKPGGADSSDDDESSEAQPALADALPRDRYLPTWYGAAQSEPARTLRLRRGALPDASAPETFGDLQAAFDAVRPDETVVIEIADQGPFFVRDVRIPRGKKVILRAAAGYAPLLVLDPTASTGAAPPTSGRCLLDGAGVALELEGLHFAAMLDGKTPPSPISLVRSNTHLSVRRCTFTVAYDTRYHTAGASGRQGQRPVVGFGEVIARDRAEPSENDDQPGAQTFAASVAAVRIGGSAGDVSPSSPPEKAGTQSASVEAPPAPVRMLLEDCFVRGAASAAVSVESPSADVLLRRTLVVSGEGPALQVVSSAQSSTGETITLRVVASTLVSERNGVLLARTNGAGKPPQTIVQMLDSIVSHPRGGPAGELLLADRWPTDADRSNIDGASWHARNSRYAGWSQLAALTRPRRTVATTADPWGRLWGVQQPNVTFEAAGWPDRPKEPLDTVAADQFASPHIDDTAVSDQQKQATDKSDALVDPTAEVLPTPRHSVGCPVDSLPPLPEYLHERAFRPFASPALSLLDRPRLESDALRIDLSDPQTDLAVELRRMQWEENHTIVVRGSGRRLVSPIRVEGKSLRLRFEAARRDEPLTLVPRLGRNGEAMIEVLGGDLEIVGGRFEATKAQPSSPRWILRAAGGNVQLTNCWLKGPFPPTQHFDGVLSWSQGSTVARDPAEEAPSEQFCRLSNCLLVGSGSLIQASISGRHLLVENTAAAGSGHLLDLELGSPHEPAGTVTVRQSTLWAHGAFFNLTGTGAAGRANRLPLRLFAAQCVFASPLELPGRQRSTTLLRCDPNLLSEAQVAWHGIDNGYADLIGGFTPISGSTSGPAEAAPRPLDTGGFDRHWARLWGPWHERHTLLRNHLTWQSSDLQASEIKPVDFMLTADSEAATWGPTGSPIGADVARLPSAPPEDQRPRDEKKPVLNF